MKILPPIARVLITAVLLSIVANFAHAQQKKPNIILFISDDHGWADSGAYGDTYTYLGSILDAVEKKGIPGACRRIQPGFERLVFRLDCVRLHRRYTPISPASPSLPVEKPLALGPTVRFSDTLLENTLLMYTSDQGSNWPFCKWCLYDGGLRVPLIVSWPGKVTAGSTSDAMVNLVDLLPTCMEAAGGSAPETMDGKSFLAVLTGKQRTHRSVIYGTHTGNENGGPGIANHCPARTIRTRTHRYILNLSPETTFTTHITGRKSGNHYLPHWDSWVKKAKTDDHAKATVLRYQHRPKEELYDLKNDPYEMNNLAKDPKHAELLNSLRKQLTEWCKTQGDTDGVNSAVVK